MTDQCKHCTLRGDIKMCKATECFHHENWYAVQQKSEIDQLKQQRDELLAALKVCVRALPIAGESESQDEARFAGMDAIYNVEGGVYGI